MDDYFAPIEFRYFDITCDQEVHGLVYSLETSDAIFEIVYSQQ
jgi:hypothetical protein